MWLCSALYQRGPQAHCAHPFIRFWAVMIELTPVKAHCALLRVNEGSFSFLYSSAFFLLHGPHQDFSYVLTSDQTVQKPTIHYLTLCTW